MNSDELIKGFRFEGDKVYFNSKYFPFFNKIGIHTLQELKTEMDPMIAEFDEDTDPDGKKLLDLNYGMADLIQLAKDRPSLDAIIENTIGAAFYPFDFETYILFAVIPTSTQIWPLSDTLCLIIKAKQDDSTMEFVHGDYVIKRVIDFHALFNNKCYRKNIEPNILRFINSPLGKLVYLFSTFSVLDSDKSVRVYITKNINLNYIKSSIANETGFPFNEYHLERSQFNGTNGKEYEWEVARSLRDSLLKQGVEFTTSSSMRTLIGTLLVINDLFNPPEHLSLAKKGPLFDYFRSHFRYL